LEGVFGSMLSNAMGGRGCRLAGSAEAARFDMKRMLAIVWDVGPECQGMGVDLVITPVRRGARKKMLLAELDSRQ